MADENIKSGLSLSGSVTKLSLGFNPWERRLEERDGKPDLPPQAEMEVETVAAPTKRPAAKVPKEKRQKTGSVDLTDIYKAGLQTDEMKVVQEVTTPKPICREMIDLLKSAVDIKGKRVLVLNVEFISDLLEAGELWFVADTKAKAEFVEEWYPQVHVVTDFFLLWETDMHFDVVAMNPPYQVGDGGQKRSSSPIYHRFIERVIDDLKPDYLVSINPSRWMIGGKGLDDFRERMVADHRIRTLVHFPGNREVFTDFYISGGVNYFLWDKTYDGACEFKVGNTTTCRYLDEYEGLTVQDNSAMPILKKVIAQTEHWISETCTSHKPFGLRTFFKDWKPSGVPCYSARPSGGKKGGAVPPVHFISPDAFTDKNGILDKWKACTGIVFHPIEDGPGISNKCFVIEPGAVCTETHLPVNTFDTQGEAENFVSYMKTHFFQFMLNLRALTNHISKDKFTWVPDLVDYTKPVTDDDLCKRFRLTIQERNYIDSKFKEKV